MKQATVFLLAIVCLGHLAAQETEAFILSYPVSKQETVVYKRVIQFDKKANVFAVKDYLENGQIQMEASYSSFDKRIKEQYQCNYRSNTKEGLYQEWYRNGQKKFVGNFEHGLLSGPATEWYPDGQKESETNWLKGQLHGRVKYWSETGDLQFDSTFDHGLNLHPKDVHYRYLAYLPNDYDADPTKKWPLIIYLHGGSDRGTDLTKLYASGIADQIYRGRAFPFVIIAPQCPEHLRWSTDNWFEDFYREVSGKYRIDPTRVYLTGFSLGGAGAWYIAEKYRDLFAAIAPISGFTSHLDYIDNHADRLLDLPIWAFHGQIDDVVPFEETERMMKKLEGRNRNLKFSAEAEVGHWIHWQVYPGQEIVCLVLKVYEQFKEAGIDRSSCPIREPVTIDDF